MLKPTQTQARMILQEVSVFITGDDDNVSIMVKWSHMFGLTPSGGDATQLDVNSVEVFRKRRDSLT